jgi:AMP nucleosidase
MEIFRAHEPSPEEEKIARDTLERYSGSAISDFQPYVLLTNFPRYVQYFADARKIPIIEGSMFRVAHCPQDQVTILDFKIGSPAAALVIDLIAHLPIKASLLLGMCGGLRRHYKVGDYFVPIASIRAEGTSDFYFPPEVPAMANFLIQKKVTDTLDHMGIGYHIGITYTTNKRFWEFNQPFKDHLELTRPQSIEMECATLFTASYYYKFPLGALLLISDLPLSRDGIKTKESSESVYSRYTVDHVEKGVAIMKKVEESLKAHPKGIYRGPRKRFKDEDPSST